MKTYRISLTIKTTIPTEAVLQLWLTQQMLKNKKDLGRGGDITINSLNMDPVVIKQRSARPPVSVAPEQRPKCPQCGNLRTSYQPIEGELSKHWKCGSCFERFEFPSPMPESTSGGPQ